MRERLKLKPLGGEIKDTKASISDDELTKWRETFQEMGLSEQEIKEYLADLNLNYGREEDRIYNEEFKRKYGPALEFNRRQGLNKKSDLIFGPTSKSKHKDNTGLGPKVFMDDVKPSDFEDRDNK